MSIKTIPETKIVICDVCEKTCNNDLGNPARRIQEGKLTLNRHGLDSYGDPCTDGTIKLDLCDACLEAIEKVINQKAREIRGK